MPTAYLSLGSNLGDRAAHLRSAIQALRAPGLRVVALSPLYETEHVGDTSQPRPDYLNCVVRLECELEPRALLHYTRSVERALGRTPAVRWAPRPIDIDLLLVGDAVVSDAELELPHPRMHERAFVLVPLSELAPALRLPDGRRIADIVGAPSVREQRIRRIDLADWPGELAPARAE